MEGKVIMSRVVMVGLCPLDVEKFQYVRQPGDLIWSCVDFWNYGYPDLKPSLCFQLHHQFSEDEWAKPFIEGYSARPEMGIVSYGHAKIPNPQYLFDTKDYVELLNMSERLLNCVFASTPAMMLAFSLLKGYRHVHMHGFAMWLESYDLVTGKKRGEAWEQGIPLLWFVDFLRERHGMVIEWPREKPLRDKYGNQALFWNPVEVEVKYGEKGYRSNVIEINPFTEGEFTINKDGEIQ